jgi:hypothetical protein
MTVFTFGSGFDTGWIYLGGNTSELDLKVEKKIKEKGVDCKFINTLHSEPDIVAILRPIKVRIFECSSREDEKCLAYKAKVIKVLKGKYNKPYITFVNDGWNSRGIPFSNRIYFLSKEYKDEDINEKVHYSDTFVEFNVDKKVLDCFKK